MHPTCRSARRSIGAIASALLMGACLPLAAGATPAQAASRARAVAHHAASHRAHGNAGALRRKLEGAARASRRADRAFVASAHSFERCLAGHHGQNAPCAQRRRSVQVAGSKLNRSERRLAHIVGASGHRRGRAAKGHRSTPAPTLTLDGQTLSWTRVGQIHTYIVMRRVPGQPVRYSIVHGTLYAPPAVPGLTVSYQVRAASPQSEWSTAVSISYPADTAGASHAPQTAEVATESEVASEEATPPTQPSEPLPIQAAPTLSTSGKSLVWSEVAGIGTYILDTRTPGGGDEYSAVHGTSFTPPAQPGKTVGYLVRTAVDGSAWSAEAKISWPAEPPPKEEEPPKKEKEATAFQPGLDAEWDFAGAATLGAKLVRVEFTINQPASALEQVIATYAAKGIRVQPLAGFYGRIPSSAEAKNLASWARAYGPSGTYWSSHGGTQEPIAAIEFGNETSYTYQFGDTQQSAAYRERGERYGERLEEAAQAISAAGSSVGLLAQADDWTGNWVRAMFKAVPGFSKYVAGWTIHPYGPTWKKRIEDLIRQTGENGAPATIPVDITEWGLSTDNGRCLSENYGWNRCMSYEEASTVLKRTVSEMRQAFSGRLQDFILYQVHDLSASGSSTDREQYFGALQSGHQAKGSFTAAVQSTLAS